MIQYNISVATTSMKIFKSLRIESPIFKCKKFQPPRRLDDRNLIHAQRHQKFKHRERGK